MASKRSVSTLKGGKRKSGTKADLDTDQSGADSSEASTLHESKADRQTVSRSRSGWTVLEEFVVDGFSYRVIRRPAPPEERPALTRRENEALAYASLGYKNKKIAQALGLAPSTVSVLLSRAASKLGTKSRRELLRAYARLRNIS